MKKFLSLIILSSIFLSACSQSKSPVSPTPTPVPREYVLTETDKPKITLTPRSDGHELTLKITGIKPIFKKIEYELVYTASDSGLEIEKGVSGTAEPKDITNGSFERKILLGTESCTSGCKYKYDAGVNGGTLNLTLNTQNDQVAAIVMPFTLTLIKSKGFTITWKQ
ncbi:MAG: hypothetical protein UU09_C0013G0004 [Microgenomates group bacterium GW2011_GWA2_40_6]|nr:MAG: hypothetical protein UU09_C0013G0004 [Microgenomates group bacterium GW2011_GWA2_40_6]